MKITVNKTLDNDVCVSQVITSDFSVGDTELMIKFAEPQIDLGGVFSTGVKASVTGNGDMSSGYDFSITQPNFTINHKGSAPVTCTLSVNCVSLSAVVTLIQTRLNGLFGSGVFEVSSTGNYVIIRTYYAGASETFTLAAGSPVDALTTLGIAPGAYTGSGHDDFVLPADLAKVRSDSPFVYKADSRDLTLDIAKYQASTWADIVSARIKTAMDDLRANDDTFTGETSETY